MILQNDISIPRSNPYKDRYITTETENIGLENWSGHISEPSRECPRFWTEY